MYVSCSFPAFHFPNAKWMFILDMFALDCQMLGKVGVYGSLVGGGGIGGRSEVMMVSYLLSFTSFALENLFRPALGYECRIYLFTLTSPTCTQKNVKYSYQKVIIK